MASTKRCASGLTTVFWVAFILACGSQSALVAITITLATNDRFLNASIYRLALAASISDVLALTALFGTCLLYIRRAEHRIRLLLSICSIILATLAAVMTIYVLMCVWNYAQHNDDQRDNTNLTENLAKAGFAIWALAVSSQAIMYAFMLWRRNNDSPQQQAQELVDRASPMRSVKRSISVHLASLSAPPAPLFLRPVSEPASPTFSTHSSSPKSSLRQSVNQVIRPVTSKTKLILRHASLSQDSHSVRSGGETSMDAIRQDDGFQTWDTSGVEDIHENTLFRKSTRGRLPTIPGSRPVSPAKPLDGPFPEQLHEEVYLPNSPVHSPKGSFSSDTSSFRFSPPQTLRESSMDQSHIHPLFRSESPVPAPLASPGTVITASPYAGQVVSSEHQAFMPRRLHSSQSFRIDSPNPLSPSRSRQGSFRSLQFQQSCPGEQRTNTSHSASTTNFAHEAD